MPFDPIYRVPLKIGTTGLPLAFTSEAFDSSVFSLYTPDERATVMDFLSTHKATDNYHHFGVRVLRSTFFE
jgi:hypothetical protein